MISLKFPPLEKFVSNDVSELNDEDPRKGVVVLNDHAIVLTTRSLVFFNLKDYFINKNSIQDQDILNDLGLIMDFMHGRMFSKAFWAELTKGAVVSVLDETLQLDGAVRKDLIYSSQTFDKGEILTYLSKSVSVKPVSVSRGALYVEPLLFILSTFKSFVKNDSIAFEYAGVNTMVRFTFKENPWIFGLVSTDPLLSSQEFLFSDMGLLYELIS